MMGTWSTAEVGATAVFVAGLTWLSVIDWRTQRLPRRLIYLTAACCGVLLVVASLVDDRPRRIAGMALGGLGALLSVGFIYVVSRGGLGDGDVRLAGLIGMVLGYWGWRSVAVGLTLGFMFGASGGLVAVALGKATLRSHIPFGPFLAAAAVISAVCHQAIETAGTLGR